MLSARDGPGMTGGGGGAAARGGSGAGEVLAALRRMLAGGPAVGADGIPGVPEAAAAVITTSGSSGVPKRVLLGRSALQASADATADRIGGGAWLLALPATYVAGLQVLHRSLHAGHEPVLLDGRFTPAAFAAAAQAMPAGIPAYTSLVPTQLADLLREAPASLRRFEAVLVGGQALPEPLREKARRAGVRVVRTYGSTETCGGCVYDGVPLAGVDVRTADGEVQLSGPVLADGYLGEPERTATAFVHDAGVRWYRTGDTGAVVDGVLHVTGRRDNVIVSGGVNVSLDRVEHIVRTLPGLTRAVVVGVDDARWGQASAVMVPAPGGDTAALLRAARTAVGDALGVPARPAHVFVVDGPLLLSTGKPDRARLRAMAAARLAV